MKSKSTLLALYLLFTLFTKAQEKIVAERLHNVLSAYASLHQFSGTAALAYKDKIIYQQSFGLADQSTKAVNTNTSQYNIGSIGKMFTTVAVLQLAEKGLLKLDQPIVHYLPEYNLPNADKITPVHLLTHTSGYGTYMRSKFYNNERVYLLSELVKIIASQPLVFDHPSKSHAYSNSAFVILGHIVEKLSGMDWWEYFQNNIFLPAGMKTVHRYKPGEKSVGKAAGYSYNAAGNYINVTNDPMPYSDGGLYATADDLVKFAQALQNGKLISEEMQALMRKKYSHFSANGWDMGLGWEIIKAGSIEMVTKGGNVQGFSGELALLPNGYSLVLLSNLSTGAFTVLDDAVQGMYGMKKIETKIAAPNFIYQQIKENGWNKIAPQMRELVEKNGYTYNFRDYVLVALTYNDEKNYLLSTSIIEQVLKEKPDYIFGYDLLGQMYVQLNEKQKAIENYRKVLSLDPANDRVAARLKELL